MSARIREAIAADLADARKAADQALERVQQLEDLDRQAEQLDDNEEASGATGTSSPPPAAVPPTASSAAKTRSTSAGRRPAAPRKARKAASSSRGEAHTGKRGASTGGRRTKAISIEDLMPRVLETLQSERGALSPTAIAGRMSIGKGTQTFQNVRAAVLELVNAGDAREDGSLRGHPTYSAVRSSEGRLRVPAGESVIPPGTRLPSGVRTGGGNGRVGSELEQKILALVDENGPLSMGEFATKLFESVDTITGAVDSLVLDRRLVPYKVGRVTPAYGYPA